jgi:hypothetical protein
MGRAAWTVLSDAELLAQCAVDVYRARGPGGQKRNKTSSAVRLRHRPSGLMVIAEESRSQHENKQRALRRLRQRLYLTVREPIGKEPAGPGLGGPGVGRRDPRYWEALGRVLDALAECQGRVSEAARLLGVSTGRAVAVLAREPAAWAQANELRQRFGQRPLVR